MEEETVEVLAQNLSELNLEPNFPNAANVQRLPLGVNLVQLCRPGTSKPIQVKVKLPKTEPNQFWSTVKIDVPETSVQVTPELKLKVPVLQQAANLAIREKKSVRIPMNRPDEANTIGVYAVALPVSTVFVGPFTINPKSLCKCKTCEKWHGL